MLNFFIYPIIVMALIFPGTLYAQWTSLLFVNVGYGHVEGFSQTPKGGSIGTTTFNRPTFQEANIQKAWIKEFGAGLIYNDYFSVLHYQPLEAHGNNILTDDLLSHTKLIPQGNDFNMNVHYQWYAITLGKNFYLPHNKWIIAPLLQGNVIKYRYHFSAPDAESTRAFSLGAVSAGLHIQHYFLSNIWIEASGQLTIPFNNVKIRTASLGLSHPFLVGNIKLIPKITLSYLRIDYEDEQLVPNHIRYTANPYGTIGLSVLI